MSTNPLPYGSRTPINSIEILVIPKPSPPPSGSIVLYVDQAIGLLAAQNSSGGSAMPSGLTPAGSNTQVQFNSSGNLGASANFTWSGTNFTADVSGNGTTVFSIDRTNGINIEATLSNISILASSAQIQITSGLGQITMPPAGSSPMTITASSPGLQICTGSTFKLGFYGATPVTQPTVTGSKGGNAALASLITQLAALGLIVDGTT